jgi:hypothetical protein
MAFQVQYICDYIVKLYKQQSEVIQNRKIKIVATSENAKPDAENMRA